MQQPYQLIVMGVSGCGKSTVGAALAAKLNYPYHDGDSYHPAENIAKMQRGEPLNDNDRQGWLETLNGILCQETGGTVIACSALKPEYREILSNQVVRPVFVYLQGDFDTIWARHRERQGHYFQGQSMLKSQFDILVEPCGDNVVVVDVRLSIDEMVEQVINHLMSQ